LNCDVDFCFFTLSWRYCVCEWIWIWIWSLELDTDFECIWLLCDLLEMKFMMMNWKGRDFYEIKIWGKIYDVPIMLWKEKE
jgi:hypothetical protein